ncbi:S8 family peptidase [Rhizobium binxianense]|uniref:S8 family peptidase n=1 Tax=Rhizobium binxianense TaxID=3024242 RepID=UPI002362F74C|nr:S8/S53 family peptidase [Rhizobium sp. MJ37]MDC9835133.1 S8/S53 family peptidase [Rhizobium sp. MJ37]
MVLRGRFTIVFACVILISNNASTEWLWRSSAGNETVISAEVEQLYLKLYNENKLATVDYIDTTGKNVAAILKEQGKIAGDMFPIGISSVMCNLNPAVCKFNSAKEPLWSNKAGDLIKIPAINFKEYTVFDAKAKVPGVSTDDLLSKSHAKCLEYGGNCQEVIKSLNDHNPQVLRPEGQGTIIVPERGFETTLDSPLDPGRIPTKNLQQFGKTSGFSLPSFENRIVPSANISPQSSYSGEPLYQKQDELFRLLNYDFAELSDISKVGNRFKKPIKIEVLDSWFDSDHCDVTKVTVIYRTDVGIARPRMNCGDPLSAEKWSKVVDHATHVIGLIAADVNGKVGGGLEPFAQILYRQVALEEFSDSVARTKLSQAIIGDYLSTKPSVFNMSWSYRNTGGRNDPIKEMIRDALQGALFVVAAGNDKSTFDDGECPAMPACLSDLPNVITVIGLNRDMTNPAVWETQKEGSNVSPKFNIGAIASDVVSTSGGNGYATASGTSQAAPQVAAAAAYIYSAYDSLFASNGPLRPGRVKNRLIYTSDLFPALLNDSVGGRLNFERALDIAFDNVIVRSDHAEPLKGSLDVSGDPVVCRKNANRDSVSISLDTLKRMHFDNDLGKYIVFYDSPNSGDPKLVRIADCELKSGAQILRFSPAGQSDMEIRLDTILDFASKL